MASFEVDGREYLRRLRASTGGGSAAGALAALTGLVAAHRGVSARFAVAEETPAPVLVPSPPEALLVPDLVGWAREALLDDDERRAGAHYTGRDIAEGLTALVVDGARDGDVFCDPACGGGAFLLALVRRLEAVTGRARREVVSMVRGYDIDPLAVAASRASLTLWCGDQTIADAVVQVADALGDEVDESGSFAAVVGNPPFRSQLAAATARSRDESAALAARHGAAATAYSDAAWLFLRAAVAMVRPGGRVALIQPQSVLGARDAEPSRQVVEARGSLDGLWVDDGTAFAAAVRTCAPIVAVGVDQAPIVRRWDRWFTPLADAPAPAGEGWSYLVSDLDGTPGVVLDTGRRVGDEATATAGFRDEYYGLVPAVTEAEPGDARPRLITSGLIDPLQIRWGRTAARFAKQRRQAPVVDLDLIERTQVRTWVNDRLRPKLLIATQTRVIEVAVDLDGTLVPCTPVVAVHADPDRLWHLAAALSGPPLCALARHRVAGAALAADAIKLSARQILDLPLPRPGADWDAAARAAERAAGADRESVWAAAVEELAVRICAAYRVPSDELVPWWRSRLPPHSR